ncbi:YdcF family protein [Maridesulfovibrio zosterae]|uniref:YdcF family protein n=1 Tax=Maridesulfovibrio zosterae TaxID=82171 RepID=UPI0003FEC1AB|nr:YdcF family protein [Maridesulfovibrio zosterae]
MKIVRHILTLIGALTVVGFLAAAILFFFAPELLQQKDTLKKADAIVVLGGQYYRPIYGAELFNKGYAPLIFASKPVTEPEIKQVRKLGITFPYQWEVFKEVLLKKGVPESRIRFFGNANVSTLEEAEELKKVLGPEVTSIILVTSPLHTRRAGIIFRKILPPKIKIIVAATPYEHVSTRWWKNFRTAPFVILEVTKTLYFEFGGAFRSTDQIINKP